MKLKKLVLQGFKSFKDKTTVHFNDGITGIVGPNGCGKSNIVDALFWVMGEQSAKHLRGKSMKDLIFAGSSKYGPGAFAEVTLVLENTGQKYIQIGKKVFSPGEIQVSRKLYRNGDSEYRINKLPARLRDIQEVFMDTGAGAKSYSVIAQGEIDRLIQAKPEERRVMIEEVAGITKFKWRKRESLKKIEQTNGNLNRLRDLQREVHKNMKSLERQAERAQRAKKLKEKIEKKDLMVSSHREFELLSSFKDYSRFIKERKLQVEEAVVSKQSSEANLELEQVRKLELGDRIEAVQREFNNLSRQLAGDEQKFNYMKRAQDEKISMMEMNLSENDSVIAESDEAKSVLLELEEHCKLASESEVTEDVLEGLRIRVAQKQEELRESEKKLAQQRSELEECQHSREDVDRILFQKKLKDENLVRTLEGLSLEMDRVEREFSTLSADFSQNRLRVNRAKERGEKLKKGLEGSVQKLQALSEEKKSLGREVDSLSESLLRKESRLEYLVELSKNSGSDSRELLENFKGSLLFSHLIECSEENWPAVHAALETRWNTIVWKSEKGEGQSEVFFQWLEEKQANADFLTPKGDGVFEDLRSLGLRPLGEIVQGKNPIIAPLLKGMYVGDQLDEGVIQQLRGRDFVVVVSSNGKRVVENLGNSLRVRGRSASQAQGFALSIRKPREKLEEEITSLKGTLDGKKKALFQVSREEHSLKEERGGQKEELSQEQIEYASANSALQVKIETVKSGSSKQDLLKEKRKSLSGEKLNILEQREALEEKAVKFIRLVEEKKLFLNEHLLEVERLKDEYSQLKEEALTNDLEMRSYSGQEKSLNDQRTHLRKLIDRNLKRLKKNNGVISKCEQDLLEAVAMIENLKEKNDQSAEELHSKENSLSALRGELDKIIMGIKKSEDSVKELSFNINRWEKEVGIKEAKREQVVLDEEQLVRNIFEKYHIDLRNELVKDENLSLDIPTEDFSILGDLSDMSCGDRFNEETKQFEQFKIEKKPYQFQRKYGEVLKEQKEKLRQYKKSFAHIGEINWQAINDYEKQVERHKFLKNQESELRISLSDLQKAIVEIDEKSESRFKLAFEEVNSRFEKVFPIIFGGGSANLKLIFDEKTSELGVDIIAQPPGKKMQNVNLMSGGEKALSAVSLIFSIFLVKPSPFCLLDEVDAPLDDVNVGRFNELLVEMSEESQFILITHNKKTMEFNDALYGVTMQEPGISTAVSVHLQ